MGRVIRAIGASLLAAVVLILTVTVATAPIQWKQRSEALSTPTDHWGTFWRSYWGEHEKVTWVAMGDSLTAGAPRFTGNGKYYLEWIEQRLQNELGKECTLVNAAIGGTHLYQFDAWEAPGTEGYGAEIVSVLFGGNDGGLDQEEACRSLESLVDKLVPTAENRQERGVPASRVVVLIGCPPLLGAESESLQALRAYGAQLSARWWEQGYAVQYIDLFDAFEALPYGQEGVLARYEDYTAPDSRVHLNAAGQYAAAQFIMEAMGLAGGESALCSLSHGELSGWTGSAVEVMATSSPAETLELSEDAQRILILGGSATAGVGLENTAQRSWCRSLEAALRSGENHSTLHVVVEARAGQEVSASAALFRAAQARFGPMDAVLCMPETENLHAAGYVHSPGEVEDYRAGLLALAEACREAGTRLVLLTPERETEEPCRTYQSSYLDALRDLAREEHLELLSVKELNQ